MTINLPDDLERVRAQVSRGLFPSADELVAQAPSCMSPLPDRPLMALVPSVRCPMPPVSLTRSLPMP